MTLLSNPALRQSVLELGAHMFKFLFIAVVAWCAVSGGTLGLGIAVYVALGYLQETRDSLGQLALASKAKG